MSLKRWVNTVNWMGNFLKHEALAKLPKTRSPPWKRGPRKSWKDWIPAPRLREDKLRGNDVEGLLQEAPLNKVLAERIYSITHFLFLAQKRWIPSDLVKGLPSFCHLFEEAGRLKVYSLLLLEPLQILVHIANPAGGGKANCAFLVKIFEKIGGELPPQRTHFFLTTPRSLGIRKLVSQNQGI